MSQMKRIVMVILAIWIVCLEPIIVCHNIRQMSIGILLSLKEIKNYWWLCECVEYEFNVFNPPLYLPVVFSPTLSIWVDAPLCSNNIWTITKKSVCTGVLLVQIFQAITYCYPPKGFLKKKKEFVYFTGCAHWIQ